MAKSSRGGKIGASSSGAGGGGSAISAGQQAMLDDVKRAQQAVSEGKRRNEIDAFKTEMRKSSMGLFGRMNPYKEDKEIQRLSENEARSALLPELDLNTYEGQREYGDRVAQDHDIVFGTAHLRSLPDEQGFATFEIPVTHTYWKGRTATNGGVGTKRKKEEKIMKVRVNILEGN